jgi:hypothetical protein
MAASAQTQAAQRDLEGEPSAAETTESAGLSPQQAQEVAYRFLARYYDYERIAPILRLLEAISWKGPPAKAWAVCELWQVSVDETLDGAPLPELPPPWEDD